MQMNTVTFSFSSVATPERQQTVLGAINDWPDVKHAGLLKPDAKREIVRRMAYVYISEESDAHEVAKRLSELPEVDPQSVSVAPSRRLV